MGRVLPLFVLLLLAAAAGVSVAPAEVGGMRTIGIVSVIGDKFYLRKVGITVFGNAARRLGPAFRRAGAAHELPARGIRQSHGFLEGWRIGSHRGLAARA